MLVVMHVVMGESKHDKPRMHIHVLLVLLMMGKPCKILVRDRRLCS
jgi:hypothetical protein